MAKKVTKRVISSLEKQLDFLSLPFKAGIDQSMYCNLELGFGVAYNLIQGVGTPIDADIVACPQTDYLRVAINRCGLEFAVTQLSREKLQVRSGEFYAYVPCLANEQQLIWPMADQSIAPMNDDFLDALHRVAPLADDKADTVLASAIQLLDRSVMATNMSVVIEAWHGVSMPPGLLLPKHTAGMLFKARKMNKKLESFGFSEKSITFHYDDQSWLKSQLYLDKLPNIKTHLEGASYGALREIAQDFFAAAAKVAPFSSSGKLWVQGNRISSHPFDAKQEGSGLALQFEGTEHELRSYMADDIKLISKIATHWNEHGRDDSTLFLGEQLRGLIWHSKELKIDLADDDIPF